MITYETALEFFEPKTHKDRFMTNCPLHGDRTPSLSVRAGNEGQALFYCHGGCTVDNPSFYREICEFIEGDNVPQTSVKEFKKQLPKEVKTVGLSIDEFAKEKGFDTKELTEHNVYPTDYHGCTAVRFSYYDEQQNPVGTSYRFKQEVTKSEGTKVIEKTFRRDDEKAVAYGVWRLEAAKEKGYLWLVEGESDALTLWSYGIPALGIPGSGRANLLQAEYLQGINTLYVLNEKDAGAKAFTAGVHARLQELRYQGNVKVIAMRDGCKDINDLHLQERDQHEGLFVDALKKAVRQQKNATGRVAAGEENYITDSIPDNDGWEPLVEFDNSDEVPPFPRVFPKWLQDYIDAITKSLEVPSDMPSMCALMSLATANQQKYLAYSKTRDWKEPLCGHYASISPPGSMKSKVLDLFTHPIKDYEKRLIEEAAPKIAKARSDNLTLTKRVDKLRNKYASNPSEELKEEIASLEADIPKIPSSPDLIVSDVTPERFSSLLLENDEKIAILTAEGGIWESIANYLQKGNGSADIFLKSHNREYHKVSRQTREGESLESPEATIGTLFQPGVIENLPPMFTRRGGIARILFSWVKGGISEEYRTPVIPQQTKASFYKNFMWLLENEADSELLDMTAEADRIFGIFFGEIGRRIKKGDLSDDELQEWAQKLRGRVLRLAGNLHLAECAEDGMISHIMEADTVRKAIELGEYFAVHVKSVFGKLGDDETVKDALFIIKHLKKHADKGRVDRTSIRNSTKYRSGLKSVDSFNAVLELLEDRNYIKVVKVRQKQVIYINPVLKEEDEPPKAKELSKPDIALDVPDTIQPVETNSEGVMYLDIS